MDDKLTEHEWRTIHNALAIYQGQFGTISSTPYTIKKREEIQRLMDKVRDNHIRTDTI